MKPRVVAVVMGLSFAMCAAHANAIPIQLDLGPSGIVHQPPIFGVLFPAPDVQLQGQNISLDFTFQSSQFIRLFTATKSFQVVLDVEINNAPSPDVFAGSGYLTDVNGSAVGSPTTLAVSYGRNGAGEVNIAQFILVPVIGSAPPLDIYDVHFDLTLPNIPGFGFETEIPSSIAFQANVLGVGPHVPRDVLMPETGDAIQLLALGLVALVIGRRISCAHRAVAVLSAWRRMP
jgi:hypothetical protein